MKEIGNQHRITETCPKAFIIQEERERDIVQSTKTGEIGMSHKEDIAFRWMGRFYKRCELSQNGPKIIRAIAHNVDSQDLYLHKSSLNPYDVV